METEVMNMIQIDKPMPENCTDCPCAGYDGWHLACGLDIMSEMNYPDYQRPSWCPLKEVGDEHE